MRETPACIVKVSSVCGGSACIGGTRIRVIDIVQAASEGYTPEQIRSLFAVSLSLEQVELALVYADQNGLEIEALYAEHARIGARIEADRAKHLGRRSG